MSFLTPLYFAAAASIALPILFHLIRRTPRQRVEFSSLMFLRPAPPRLTRRSRLDQWLLLLLRAALLVLLALAFSRPFLRESWNLTRDFPGRHIAILLDDSASMQRSRIWQQATEIAKKVIGESDPADFLALFTFDDRLRTIVDFDSTRHDTGRKSLLTVEVDRLSPGWGHTDLASAVTQLADSLYERISHEDHSTLAQIVLISDLQMGSSLKSFEEYEWPERVAVDLHPLLSQNRTNASVRLFNPTKPDKPGMGYVRIANAKDSDLEQFQLSWTALNIEKLDELWIPIQVPAGTSHVTTIKLDDKPELDAIVLLGDDCEFDNHFYVAHPRQVIRKVLYIGQDSVDDPEGISFYLKRALVGTEKRKYHFDVLASDQPLDLRAAPDIIVVTQAVPQELRSKLDQFVTDGGSLLVVPGSVEALNAFATLFDLSDSRESKVGSGGYTMLGELDFRHPVFATFGNPQYSDFTSIHFWKYREVTFTGTSPVRVVARFEDGWPAFCESTQGDGQAFLLTSGWHPADSQLALSSKFVPLISAIFEYADQERPFPPSYVVHESVSIPARFREGTVVKPDGTQVQLNDDGAPFRGTDVPGIYTLGDQEDPTRFAVNLAPSESQTTPLERDDLEQLGVFMGRHDAREEIERRERQMRDIELEGRQKIWRWLIVIALVLLPVETAVAARKTRLKPGNDGK